MIQPGTKFLNYMSALYGLQNDRKCNNVVIVQTDLRILR